MENNDNLKSNVVCSKCGSIYPIGSNFCVKCGEPLISQTQQSINNSVIQNNVNVQQSNGNVHQNNANTQQNNGNTQHVSYAHQNLHTRKNNNGKYGLLVLFGIFSTFLFLLNFKIIGVVIFGLLMYFYIKDTKPVNAWADIFRVIGLITLFGLVLGLILFGMCIFALG